MTTINILQYESKVWQTADLLIGAGIKQSDFPKYMMPFFALVMVESRLIRESNSLLKEYVVESISDLDAEDLESFIEEFSDRGLGYNDFVIPQGTKLADFCENDKTFDIDFDKYLKAFDIQTESLLGVDKGNEEEKFMNISGICGLLKNEEEAYMLLKSRIEVENFSGKTAKAVKQDFFAKVFLMTLCAAYAHLIEEKVIAEYEADEKRKHGQKINRTNALSMTQNILIG